MATTQAFAYNTGGPIAGTTQFGDFAIGIPTTGYTNSPQFWNGPDEDLGYIIAQPVPAGNQPNPVGGPAYLGFFRTDGFSDSAFIDLAIAVAGQVFSTTTDAYNWIDANGYYTSFTPIPVTGFSFNLIATPYSFPSSGNSIMNNTGDFNTGSTEINVLATGGRGFYFNSFDTDEIDRTSYYSTFTGQSVTITFNQTGNTAIYSGDTDSFKYWQSSPTENGFVFGAGIGAPPSFVPSGAAVLIQSATTNYTIGFPVYVSLVVN